MRPVHMLLWLVSGCAAPAYVAGLRPAAPEPEWARHEEHRLQTNDGISLRVQSWRPLAALGLISYGVYVLHWPIFTFLTPDTTGLDGVRLVFVRVGITLAIAIASYRWLEQPIRSGRVRLRSVPVIAGVVVITTGLLVAATVLDRTSAVRDVVATPDLALSSPAGAQELPPPPVPPPPLRRVLFVGDSLVHQSFNTLSARMSAAKSSITVRNA